MKKIVSWLLILTICITSLLAVSCKTETGDDPLDRARSQIFLMYKDKSTTTASDFERVSVVVVDGVSYKVEWTCTDAENVKIDDDGKKALIDVNESSPVEVNYELVATVKDDKGNASKPITYKYTIPAFKTSDYNDYAAAAKGDSLVLSGTVTGLLSKSLGDSSNGLYFQDSVGGIYVYNLSSDPVADLGIAAGMKVTATGTKDLYNGTYELVSASIVIDDKTITEVAPTDITEAYKNATSLKDDALVGKQALLVTIKGVEVTGEDTSSGYYKFKLGELETYVRISSSNCPLNKEDTATFIAEHAAHLGYVANVTGLVTVYDGALYLTPVSVNAFEYIGLPEKSDAEKIAFEKEALTLTKNITAAGSVDLAAAGKSYSDVAITWTSDNAVAKVEGGKLTIAALPAAETKVNVTATLKCGTVTETVVFEVVVDAEVTTVYKTEKVTAPTAGTAYVFGMTQAKVSKDLYFSGEMSGNYLATTDKVNKAATVYLEADGANFRLYFEKDGVKNYVEIYEYTTGKAGIQIVTTPTMSYTWNAELGILTANVASSDRYLGAYNTYETMSASATTYITGDNASKVGESQFPAYLFTVTAQ